MNIDKVMKEIEKILQKEGIDNHEGDQYGAWGTDKLEKIKSGIENVLGEHERKKPFWEGSFNGNFEINPEYPQENLKEVNINKIKRFISWIVEQDRKLIFKAGHVATIIEAPTEFTANNNEESITGHWCEDNSPYEITVPHQLRDIFIGLLNNLREKYTQVKEEEE